MAAVTLRRLSKHYGDTVALRETTLRVENGEFCVLLGPSGSGKSTILRLIAGLEDATAGEIVVGERLVNFVEPSKRNVAMVFQNYALYPHMTVEKNIAFPLEMARQPKTQIRAAVDRTAGILGLAELLRRYPDQLSGGQRQRVALARAIVREPQVFLMDEPLSNLDASLRVETREELLRLHQRLGSTFLYVTHDQLEAMTMGQRIVVLRDGAVQQIGTPYAVYNEPSNVFVARFIGSPAMNLITGSLTFDADRWHFQSDGFRMSIDPVAIGADSKSLARLASDAVQVGIRPEDIRLDGPEAAGLNGKVQLVEPVGSDVFLRVQTLSTTVHVRTTPNTDIREGENVTLSFAPKRCHLFASDGRNVRVATDRLRQI